MMEREKNSANPPLSEFFPRKKFREKNSAMTRGGGEQGGDTLWLADASAKCNNCREGVKKRKG
jgi:hypothetical protein